MGAIRQRITFRLGVLGELFHILHFKSQMSKVGTHRYWAAIVKFTDLDLLIAMGCFQKYELRSATRRVSPKFLQSQHLFVERDRFLQVVDAIARMQQFLDHGLFYDCRKGIQTLALDKVVKTA